jgi:putative sugar O-methyltransferase
MSNAQLQLALSNVQKVRSWYQENRIYERYKLSPIWIHNLDKWFNRLFSEDLSNAEAKDLIAFLHDKAFFDVSVPNPQLSHALDWFQSLLSRKAWPLRSLPPQLEESSLFSEDRCAIRDGRRVSTDFLWRLALIERLGKAVRLSDWKMTVLELGSGSGNFARAFKLLHPNTTYICIDLPESLFFANLYLYANFPDSRILYISEPDQAIANLSDYDFVFIPTEFATRIVGHSIDLFVNMNSMGEMTNEVIDHWFDFIQNRIEVSNVFLLNRFLNRINPNESGHRREESSCSLHLDEWWEILDWEVDPDFERSPYVTTLITRNLLVIARRNRDAALRSRTTEEVLTKLPGVSREDWAVRPYWDEYVLKTGGKYPPLNSRADLNFTLDLTKTGSLFVMWEAFRLLRSANAARLLWTWMEVHGGLETPFEELFFLQKVISGSAPERECRPQAALDAR